VQKVERSDDWNASLVEPLGMSETSSPSSLHFLLLLFSGWVNRHQNQVIDYLMEENRVLRDQIGGRRLRLTDHERRRLAVKGKVLGRKVLRDVAGIVTPFCDLQMVSKTRRKEVRRV
jgi:hypothetical protein